MVQFDEDSFISNIEQIYLWYKKLLEYDIEQYANGTMSLNLPIISSQLLTQILEKVQSIFEEEPIVLDLQSPVITIGDLHGHLLDLLRIIKEFPLNIDSNEKYLFLGDLVDRGEFSTETITLVFILKILFPANVYIIRGNHEFAEMCDTSGFRAEVERIYHIRAVYDSFLSAFGYMPIAAYIDKETLCIHGGIGPGFGVVSVLDQVQRPITTFNSEAITELFWSDPSDDIQMFGESQRGLGHLFGSEAVKDFLMRSNLRKIIRGHQCVDGVSLSLNARVFTVFSASNYCGPTNNSGGVLYLHNDGRILTHTYPPLKYLMRNGAIFFAGQSLIKFLTKSPATNSLTNNENHNKTKIKDPKAYCRSNDVINGYKRMPVNRTARYPSYLPAAKPQVNLSLARERRRSFCSSLLCPRPLASV